MAAAAAALPAVVVRSSLPAAAAALPAVVVRSSLPVAAAVAVPSCPRRRPPM
jgi:hypothetical protein